MVEPFKKNIPHDGRGLIRERPHYEHFFQKKTLQKHNGGGRFRRVFFLIMASVFFGGGGASWFRTEFLQIPTEKNLSHCDILEIF